ncbi:MAG: glycosyltransferase [Candidatus Cyclonatronum sp.]|uniref:glycosyltransferase n=1 Tax=Cyclonatronum sp. TaxID=3024185 RepID=UPI0025C1533F|nr:glycosyltransferase [Cyclonatronum sp.]MCH8487710.1 glycosyltransferase [Cyclonatronum sp.]
MKVLIVAKGYPTREKPFVQSFIRDEACLLHRQHQVMVLDIQPFKPGLIPALLRPASYPADGFPVERAPYLSVPRHKLPQLTRRGLAARVGDAISRFQPDVLHAHFLYPGILALQEARRIGVPTVLTLHGADWYAALKTPAVKKLAAAVLPQTGRIICVGPGLHRDVVSTFPELSSTAEVVLHGTDYSFFKPATAGKSAAVYPRILCVARFVHKKGLHLLVEAVAGSDKLRNCPLTIIGDITDAAYHREILAQIRDSGLTNISLLPGMGREALREQFYAHDFYVQPSIDEPFGLALLEAIACGLPAVAFRSGGPDVIVTPQNGMLLQKPDAAALRQALEDMCSAWNTFSPAQMHADLADRFSENAKRSRLTSIYESLRA